MLPALMDEVSRCYQLLGLEVGSSQEEVKRAYRDLVRVWHPDRFAHDERLRIVAQDKLKEINGAYETLNAKFFNDSISPPPQEEPIEAVPEPEAAPVDEPAPLDTANVAQSKVGIWIGVLVVCLLALGGSGVLFWKHRMAKTTAPIEQVAVYHPELKGFEMILNADSAVYVGNWPIGNSAKDRRSKSYHYAGTVEGSATATATFTPIIPATGNYDVYVWYAQGPKRAINAPFQIVHAGETNEAKVNETIKGGRWQLIAEEVPFRQGTNGYVRLSNDTGEAGRVVIIDSVRFVYSTKQ
ncbi:MAG: heat shock protein DnaJ domain protein [Pedosphaera sp.]|nr:heat shock protein DnaJ domain protein [Pedosphaera sp.]